MRASRKVADRVIEFVGTDDAHLSYDRYDDVAGPPDTSAELTIGVTHAPYLRVIDAMAADGVPLIFAGHTHGGQVCLPGVGALVTNCDLPTKSGERTSPARLEALAARVGGSGNLAVYARAICLSTRGDAGHAAAPARTAGLTPPDSVTLAWIRYADPALSGCGAAW